MSDSPPATNDTIQWSGMTHVGKIRKNNEDTFLALTSDGRQISYLGKVGEAPAANTDFVFAVSDGMGGERSGEFASRISIDTITKLMPRGFRVAATGLNSGFQDILLELFGNIHRDLLSLGASYDECRGMGATLSLCWFAPGWMYFGHIGDSRIYFAPKTGPFQQLTHDHSYVGHLRRSGQINEREARTHPRRNALQQALGAGNQFMDPHIGAVGISPGDRFLICSDGVVDGLWDYRIEELLRSGVPCGALAARFVHEAVASSGRDNTTAVVIEISAPNR